MLLNLSVQNFTLVFFQPVVMVSMCQPIGVDVMCHINSRAPAVCGHRCVI